MDVPFSDLVPLYPLIVPFALVLFRVVGLFTFVPVFSNTAIPGNIKILLALAISVCVWGGAVGPHGAPLPVGLVGLAIAVIGELSVGMLIGLLTNLIFMGVQTGAHLVSQQMGLAMAAVYDPMFDQQSTVVEQIAFWLALMIFLAMGGHRELINALVQSFQRVPLGRGLDPAIMLEVALGAMTSAFALAARVGAPALVVFMLATLASGFVGKSMPQINIMSIGLGLNLVIGIMMISVCLTGWALVSQDAWQGFFETLHQLFGG
jgi:flagellar biosynthetic protein FliR